MGARKPLWRVSVNLSLSVQKEIAGGLKNQILPNARLIRYCVAGCVGIAVNLSIMALLFTISSQRGWIPSAMANVISTIGNFVFHNQWTFSDRQHQGFRLIRGFLSFALMSVAGICVTTAAYVGLTRIATHLMITNSHRDGVGTSLMCQL